MKNIFILLHVLCYTFMHISLKAQYFSNGKNEFVCLSGDTCFFKMNNDDAFNTISIGAFKVKRLKSRLRITDSVSISNIVARIQYSSNIKNSTKIIVVDNDGTPIPFVEIKLITNPARRILLQGYSDNLGVFEVNNTGSTMFVGDDMVLSIKSVGIDICIPKFKINPSYDCLVTSLLEYPYIVKSNKKHLSIRIINNEAIMLVNGNMKTFLNMNSTEGINCMDSFGKR